MLNVLRSEVIFGFVDIGALVDHHFYDRNHIITFSSKPTLLHLPVFDDYFLGVQCNKYHHFSCSLQLYTAIVVLIVYYY
jgi:hypothetical protein